jgi:chorismate mutase
MVTLHDTGTWRVRAVRGATTVEYDDPDLMSDAIRELLSALLGLNEIGTAEIVSAVFTATPDLRCAFPARAAREEGWTDVPMLCAAEIDVPGAQQRCLRVLLHVERRSADPPLIPVYLRDAVSLRPDIAATAEPLAR